jgi:hypothetical protein
VPPVPRAPGGDTCLGEPAAMDAQWGVCATSASTGAARHRGRSDPSTNERMLTRR